MDCLPAGALTALPAPEHSSFRTPHSALRNPQSGSVFVAALILLAGMSVVLLALANEVTLDFRMTAHLADGDQAMEIAKVGLDNLIYLADHDANWRTTYTSGIWIANKAVGDGSFTASGIDEDGNLSDCPIDPVTARSVGTYKGSVRTLTATLTPPPHDALMYLAAMWISSKEIRIKDGPRVYGDLASNGKVTLDGAAPDLRGNLYVRDANLVDNELDDDNTDVIETSDLPAQPQVDFDWFISRASRMWPPMVGSAYVISDKRIAPDVNPHGFANANGLYYIDARDRDVKFIRCHITGTLIVKNAAKVTFDKACVHAPAEPYYPAVVVEGEIIYSFDENLSEPDRGVDFNGDGDKNDKFTPSVSGIVYCTRKFTGLQATGGTNVVRFKGTLIANNIILVGSGCIFEQDPALATTLVNQFQGNGLELVKGSVKIE